MFSLARFNAWVSATGYNSAKEMEDDKEGIMDYFSSEYKKMLEENIDDYVANFDTYMTPINEDV